MPKRTKNMIQQVEKLIDRASMYGSDSQSYRSKAGKRFRQVARFDCDATGSSADFEYMNPDLDNWDTDSDGRAQTGMGIAQTLSKDFGCLNDMYADDSLDLMIETIGKMRAAGATRADMDRAWAIYSSAQS